MRWFGQGGWVARPAAEAKASRFRPPMLWVVRRTTVEFCHAFGFAGSVAWMFQNISGLAALLGGEWTCHLHMLTVATA